jgi:hypothetical protein
VLDVEMELGGGGMEAPIARPATPSFSLSLEEDSSEDSSSSVIHLPT